MRWQTTGPAVQHAVTIDCINHANKLLVIFRAVAIVWDELREHGQYITVLSGPSRDEASSQRSIHRLCATFWENSLLAFHNILPDSLTNLKDSVVVHTSMFVITYILILRSVVNPHFHNETEQKQHTAVKNDWQWGWILTKSKSDAVNVSGEAQHF